MSMAKNFVDVLVALQSAQIPIYDGVDPNTGEPKLVNFKQFDIENVSDKAGKKLANLMTGFIKVFDEEWSIFTGYHKAKMKAITESIQGFVPLFEQVTNLISHAEVLQDTAKMDIIKSNLNTFVLSLIKNAESINSMNDPDLVKLYSIIKFFGSFESFQKTDWKKASDGIKIITANVIKIVDKINNLDLEKALALKNTLSLFTQAKLTTDTKESMNKIIEMIDKIGQYGQIITQNQGNLDKSAKAISQQALESNRILKESANSAITGQILTTNLTVLYEQLKTVIENLSNNTYKTNITGQTVDKLKVEVTERGK
jgi:DNA-directed RNA polymerase subunit F